MLTEAPSRQRLPNELSSLPTTNSELLGNRERNHPAIPPLTNLLWHCACIPSCRSLPTPCENLPLALQADRERKLFYDRLQNLWPARSGTDNGFDAANVIDRPCRSSRIFGEYRDGCKR